MNKLIITCALTGAEVTKDLNPAIPYTAAEMAQSAREAVDAGASILHIHARHDDGKPTQDAARFKVILDAIREACPEAILQVSTGGATGMSRAERLQPLSLNPEMATLDCGTLNFGGDEIFINTENDIIAFADNIQKRGIYKELECFEKGHVDLALRLHKKGYITAPLHFSFVLGVNGGMTGEERDFHFMRGSIPTEATYSVAGVGRFEFPLAGYAIKDGGHVRVGFEDNIYLEKGVLATSNAQLVEKVVRMAQNEGRSIASPAEARRILGMEDLS